MKKFQGYEYRDVQMGDLIVEANNKDEAREKIIKEMLKNLEKWLNKNLTIYEIKEVESEKR